MDSTVVKKSVNVQSPTMERLERIALCIQEQDIDVNLAELVIRDVEELLLLREYRAMKVEKLKNEAANSLKPLKGQS